MSDRKQRHEALMKKADTACVSARALLELGDMDGACNRAYYAIFDAARAALLIADVATSSRAERTHSGLINAFGLHLVKNGSVSKEMGRLLNRAHEVRLIADYRGESVEFTDATDMVDQAEYFVATIRLQLMSP